VSLAATSDPRALDVDLVARSCHKSVIIKKKKKTKKKKLTGRKKTNEEKEKKI
jgi:hypothetical protein